jgi:photosystem II stability/assembly factor-like uncharacterized protein
MPRRTLCCRCLAGVTLALALAALCASGPSRAEEAEASREQQIAELQRQIAELTAKLEELRRAPAPNQPRPTAIPDEWVKELKWRCVGPASMGGRIVALSVFDADPSTYWVATASGGLLKTVNNGVTFEHQFDREATVSIGDVCVAPSNRDVVWVGTGENNPRNSVSYGDGLYKSTDGGKTWKNMGLKKTFQVGKIIVHPKNPDIVYVGALGRLYGPNEERGLFKTTDGGKTWERIFYVDDKTGVVDMRMHPADPETLLVAMWERKRDGFDSHRGEPALEDGYDAYDPIKKWGKNGGIYRTTDGGKNFKKVTEGLPSCGTGRIGLDWYLKDPKVVFAVIDSEKIGMGVPPPYLGVQGEDAPAGAGARLTAITENSPAATAGLKAGDIVKAVDKKEVKTYQQFVDSFQGRKVGDKMELTVLRGTTTLTITATLGIRPPETAQAGGGRRGGGGRGAGGAAGGRGAGGRGGAGGLPFRGEDAPNGVRVTQVGQAFGGPQGLQVDDVIQSVGRTPVKTFREAIQALRAHNPGEKITLKVVRGKDTKDVSVTLAATPGAPTRAASATRPYGFQYGGQQANVVEGQTKDTKEYGGVYKSTDAGVTWVRVNSLNPRPMYFSQVRVDPSDDKLLYVLGIQMYHSTDGGKTFRPFQMAVHPDQHCLWINPRDGRNMIVGCDGGFYATYDRGAKWDYLNNVAIGQFYHVALDTRTPYRAYGGLQDNGSWGGPSHALDGQGPINADWVMVGGGDGFVCRVDQNDPDLVYWESQDGNIQRRNLRTGSRGFMRPRPQEGLQPFRFNWNTPFILSSHNSQIFYSGGNYVFRSVHQGDDLRVISPLIARTGRGTATALAESPRNPQVLYAGTDDGYLWVTRDGGNKWTNVTANAAAAVPGKSVSPSALPWVATIEASRFADGRVYVALDAHRSDDDEPYLLVSEDYGQTWKSLRGNLPTGSTRVLREDLQKPDVLYCGTEFAVWASVDRGGHWTKINNNLPTVAVHELAQHPTAGEMVAATHGRSLWVLDVSALRQVTPQTLQAGASLFAPQTAVRWRTEPTRGTTYGAGNRNYFGTNPDAGAHVWYALTKKASKVTLKVQDYTGRTVAELPAKAEPGLHRLTWDIRGGGFGRDRGQGGFNPAMLVPASGAGVMPLVAQQAAARQGQAGGRGGGGQGRGGFGRGGQAAFAPGPAPGMYRVVLNVDGQDFTQGLRIEADPVQREAPVIAEPPPKERPRAYDDD